MCVLVKVGNNSPAFVIPKGSGVIPVTYSQFQNFLRVLILNLGLNPNSFSSHSFRCGSATFAFQSGIPANLIQAQRDWTSETYIMQYISVSMNNIAVVGSKIGRKIVYNSSLGVGPFGVGRWCYRSHLIIALLYLICNF